MPTTVNDSARATRVISFGLTFFAALMLTSLLRAATAGWSVAWAFAIGAVGWVVMMAVQLTWTLRINRRLIDDAARRSAPLAAGQVERRRVPGRVLRTRPAPGRPAFVDSGPVPPGVASRTVLSNVLTDAGPRRALSLVPAGLVLPPGAPVALLVDPDAPDVGVLDTTIDLAGLQAGDADPRWASARPPTAGSVAGGWGVLVVVVLVAAGLGIACSWLLSALLG